jgi:thiamine-monophosphate kinase
LETAEQLGERKIIETIWRRLDKAPKMPVPFGDDVSAVEYGDERLAVLKTDMLVGRTDVPPQMSLWQAARKAVIMNISDFAAKGVKPLGLLVSLGIPPKLTKRDIEQIGAGLNAGAREHGAYVLGGDTSETEDLIISVALFGLAKRGKLILRGGAQSGDIVATTGLFGLTSCGLKVLTEKLTAPVKVRRRLVNAVLMPHARLREGLALAKTCAVTAAIDSSDGLAWSLYEISRASNVGFTINTLPIAPETLVFAGRHELDPLKLCLYGGEEYELVITIKLKNWTKVKAAVEREGGNLIEIGRATAERDLMLKQNGEIVKIEARGYEHFKQR